MTPMPGGGRESPGTGIGAFVLGSAVGLLSGVLLSRPRVRESVASSVRGAAMLLGRATGIGGESAGGLLGRWLPESEDEVDGVGTPDPSALEAAVESSPLSGRVRARVLGAGVVELSGTAENSDASDGLDELERTLRALPGVDFVVNRVWTAERTPRTGGG